MSNTETLNTVLQETLYLEPEDLEANRAGKISERQKLRVRAQIRSVWLAIGCLLGITTLPLVILALIFGNTVIQLVVIILALVWASGFVRFGVGLRKQYAQVYADLDTGEAYYAEGFLKKEKRNQGRESYLGLSELWFPVPHKLYDVITEGEYALVYYMPNSKQILALEYANPVHYEEYQTI